MKGRIRARAARALGILIVGVGVVVGGGVGGGVGVGVSVSGADTGVRVGAPTSVVVAPVPDTLTLVLVGDVGLNRSGTAVDARGVLEGPTPTPWTELSAKVATLIDGDLNFMNLETVVTDRNDLHAADKGQAVPFGFRSHPAGVRALTTLGFNLVSAANNHAYDFGADGARETVRHLGALAAEGRLHFSGIGLNREQASRPVELLLPVGRVAFSAIGIVTNNINAHRATADKPGTVAYRIDEDWREVTRRLGETKADYRILSIHYGEEKDVRADDRQLTEWRAAADRYGADLVVGHHAHVVRGVEIRHGVPIFYGLGNFMLRGARDMGAVPEFAGCRDYGLLARLHLKRMAPGGRLVLRAIEIVPIRDMHRQPAPFPDPGQAARRIEVVNLLSARLDDPTIARPETTRALFAARPDGVGLYCAAGADADPGAVGQLCRGWSAPALPPPAAQAEIMRQCTRPALSIAGAKGKARVKGGARVKAGSKAISSKHPRI
ncbi:MAG TPA: CapA family protein [Polyangia bacterium]|nr:CapA family protein [Polyangia bacterium]